MVYDDFLNMKHIFVISIKIRKQHLERTKGPHLSGLYRYYIKESLVPDFIVLKFRIELSCKLKVKT